ncbi:MAG: hypothetical protein GY950_22600 [bacterium]|nr:hypothetical protein [bacterium]
MQSLALKISEELKTLHPLYMKEVYDFVTFLKEKQKKQDDTEYLSQIPGMADSIIKEANRPLSEYSDKLDW